MRVRTRVSHRTLSQSHRLLQKLAWKAVTRNQFHTPALHVRPPPQGLMLRRAALETVAWRLRASDGLQADDRFASQCSGPLQTARERPSALGLAYRHA